MLASQRTDNIHVQQQPSRVPSFTDNLKRNVLGFGRSSASNSSGSRSSGKNVVNVISSRNHSPQISTERYGIPSQRPQTIAVVGAITSKSVKPSPCESQKFIGSMSKGQDAISQDGDNFSCDSINDGREISQEEMAILQKIEAQNRLLESDTKSMKSISSEGGRRNSGGSLSPTSNGSPEEIDEDQWTIWGRIVTDWDDFKKKREKQLKELVRHGIPHHFRGIVWQLLCGAHRSPIKDQYVDLLKRVSPSEKLIKRDIARTYPENEFFKGKVGQEVLFNVTKAYSLVDREVGYCQGSAFIAGLLLLEMPEEEAFAVFVTLMKNYRLRELFKPSMAELGLCMFQLDNMVQDHAPDLYIHFQAQGFHTSMYASSWFLTLFATTFNLQVASRIMDVFMSEGMEVIFRIGLAMLLSSQQQLLHLDMEGMLSVISKALPEFYNKDPDLLFNKAYTLVKYNPKKMKKLEKEYMTMKTKEMEEQVEMRRLRTENRLLRQRVDALEQENENLADKLIQDRVNRALEAEEKIIMGKELSIAKRQVRLSQNSFQQLMSHNDPFALNYDGESRDSSSNETSPSPVVASKPLPPQSVPYSEGFVLELQQELVQARLREAECTSSLSELQEKVTVLEKKNQELTDTSQVKSLQEELIVVKLREAEISGSLKHMQQKVMNLEEHWQSHLARTGATRKASSSSKASKASVQELQDELMSAKFRETQLTSQNTDTKKKLMELETSNQICSSQLRRADEERNMLRDKLEKSSLKEKSLLQQVNELRAKMAQVESKSQESLIAMRFREADSTMELAEMKQKIQTLESKCSELEDSKSEVGIVSSPTTHPDTAAILQELQEKVLHQQKVINNLRKSNKSLKHAIQNDSSTSQTECNFRPAEDDGFSEEESDTDDTELILDTTLTDPEKVLNTDIKCLMLRADEGSKVVVEN